MIRTVACNYTKLVSGILITKEYSFLIKDLEDLPNEIWREIPHTNGYYEVSNLGRIKSTDREILTKDGKLFKYKGKILTQSILKLPNHIVGDFVYELICTIGFESARKTISLNRVIYSVFVTPLNFNEDKLVILHKNNDKLDNRVENLYTGTLNDKAQQIYNRKRGHKVSNYITEEAKKIGILNRCKSVSQYTMTGQKIGLFKSIKDAALKTKISGSSIVAACKQKKMISAGGYLWQYGNGNFIIDVTYYTKFIEKSKAKTKKTITQFTKEGYLIANFNSIEQASKKTGIKTASISCCINGHTTTAGGYLWQKGKFKENIDVSHLYQDIAKSIKFKKKPLLQICPITHKIINIFSSSSEAAQIIKSISARSIRAAATSKKITGNYLWRFK